WAENWKSRQAGTPPPNVVEGSVTAWHDMGEGVGDSWSVRLAAWPIQPTGGSGDTWQLTGGTAEGDWFGIAVHAAISPAATNRDRLRRALRDLAADQYWVLLVSGPPRSGKSYTWVLVRQLRDGGKLTGQHTFVRLSTHDWAGEVTGEDLLSSL